jgi:hypothetical protein
MRLSCIDPRPGPGRIFQDPHVDIAVIKNSGFLLPRRRPEHPSQVLDEPPVELDGRRQEQGRKPPAIEALSYQLAGGHQHLYLARVKGLHNLLTVPVAPVPGKFCRLLPPGPPRRRGGSL